MSNQEEILNVDWGYSRYVSATSVDTPFYHRPIEEIRSDIHASTESFKLFDKLKVKETNQPEKSEEPEKTIFLFDPKELVI